MIKIFITIYYNLSYYNLSENDTTTTSAATETVIVRSRQNTPIVQTVNIRAHATTLPTTMPRRSRTPVIDLENPTVKEQDITLPLDNFCNISAQAVNLIPPMSYHDKQWEEILMKQGKEVQKILIKQGKQIRALYELQKSTNERITWIVNQVKQQNSDKDNDLNPKVFMVSNFIVSNFICQHIKLTIILLYTTNHII